MTIEQQLFTVLNAVAPTYPMIAPDGEATPYILYQGITDQPQMSLTGETAQNKRIQIDAYSNTYAGVKTLEASVDLALDSSGIVIIPKNRTDLYESDVKLYRVQMDFSVWY
jgi:hypothetical protein